MTDKRYLRPVAAVAMAVFGSVQLLYPNPYMAEQLRATHLIEVSVSMAIFGWLVAGIYVRSVQKIEPQNRNTEIEQRRNRPQLEQRPTIVESPFGNTGSGDYSGPQEGLVNFDQLRELP